MCGVICGVRGLSYLRCSVRYTPRGSSSDFPSCPFCCCSSSSSLSGERLSGLRVIAPLPDACVDAAIAASSSVASFACGALSCTAGTGTPPLSSIALTGLPAGTPARDGDGASWSCASSSPPPRLLLVRWRPPSEASSSNVASHNKALVAAVKGSGGGGSGAAAGAADMVASGGAVVFGGVVGGSSGKMQCCRA